MEKGQQTKKIPIYRRSESFLTTKQKFLRERSLAALSEARKTGKSLSKVSRQHELSYKTVLHNTKGFKKVNGRWIAKKYDKIPRVMKINENGRETSFEISDSRTASTIGKYHNAVKEFLHTGKVDKLLKFKYRKIRDSQGNYHRFEANLQTIIEIEQRKETPEFYVVYGT